MAGTATSARVRLSPHSTGSRMPSRISFVQSCRVKPGSGAPVAASRTSTSIQSRYGMRCEAFTINCAVSGAVAYVADWYGGMRVIDVDSAGIDSIFQRGRSWGATPVIAHGERREP